MAPCGPANWCTMIGKEIRSGPDAMSLSENSPGSIPSQPSYLQKEKEGKKEERREERDGAGEGEEAMQSGSDGASASCL